MNERSRVLWPLAALALLLAVNAMFNRSFFHIEIRHGRAYGAMVDVLNRGAPVMLLSLGMSLVIATGGIDLSVGAVMAIAGAVAADLIANPDGSPLGFIQVHNVLLIIAIALLSALIAGAWNGVLVVFLRLQPIVATLILMVAGRGIAQLLTAGQIVTFDDERFAFLARGSLFGLPFPVTIVTVMAIVIGLLSRGTAMGLFVESVGNNPTASRLAGVPANFIKLAVYALCGLCAGMAGLVVTADIQGADANNSGLYLELDAILAVSLGGASLNGGRFSLTGSLIGAILLQALTGTMLERGTAPELIMVVKGAVVTAVCLLQSPTFRAKLWRAK